MPQFRKKPVVINAFQWTGKNPFQLGQWYWEQGGTLMGPDKFYIDDELFVNIPTLEGVMKANPGDYIICGVQGEFYPCKPEIFDATYEAV